MAKIMRHLEARIIQLEERLAARRARQAEIVAVDEAAVLARWRELRDQPVPPRPLPASIAMLSDAECILEWRRLGRCGIDRR
jgi:hypothetical protein